MTLPICTCEGGGGGGCVCVVLCCVVLWSHSLTPRCLLARSYLDSIDRIMDADYICTDEDILKSRVRTSGIVEEKYKIDGVDFVYVGRAPC